MNSSAKLQLQNKYNVSRETLEKLEIFVELLCKWNKSINLIANPKEDIWQRHILDSAQLSTFLSPKDKIIDIGAGGGFPGLVLAIMGFDVTLVDSDNRKIAFLNFCIAHLKLFSCRTFCTRVETIEDQCYDVLTCRAFSDIPSILELTKKIQIKNKYLLLRGSSEEIFDYGKMRCVVHNSITNNNSKIIELII